MDNLQGSNNKKPRVLMIDENKKLLEMYIRLLGQEGIEAIPLVIETISLPNYVPPNSLDEVLPLVRRHTSQPHKNDVITIDLNLAPPQKENFIGLDILRAIKDEQPQQKCIILTQHPSLRSFYAALKAGAEGFVEKSAAITAEVFTLGAIIKGVINGQRYYDGDTVLTIADYIEEAKLPFSQGDKKEYHYNPLTEKQCQVLRLVAQGLSNKQIGLRLGMKEPTVGVHLRDIYAVLNLDFAQSLTNEEKRKRAVSTALAYGWLEQGKD